MSTAITLDYGESIIRLIDLATCKTIREAKIDESRPLDVAIYPGSDLVAVGFFYGTHIINTDSLRVSTTFRNGMTNVVAVSSDGKYIANGSMKGDLLLSSLPAGSLVSKHQEGRQSIDALAFSPDSLTLVSGSLVIEVHQCHFISRPIQA